MFPSSLLLRIANISIRYSCFTQLKISSQNFSKDGRTCDGLCLGQIFSYGFEADKGLWTPVDDTKVLDLGIRGDTILTYCLDADGQPHFIHGFSYAEAGWAEPGLEDYGSDKSSVPVNLIVNGPFNLTVNASIELPFFKNYIYTGTPHATKKTVLLDAFSRPESYKGSNEIRNTLPEQSSSSNTSARVSLLAALAALVLVPMAMM